MTREWAGVVATAVAGQDAGATARRPARRRHRRHGPRAARQRAVPADHRARPRADPALPARPPRPLAGPDPRAHRGARSRDGQAAGDGPRRATPTAMARALVLAAHGFVLSAHTMVDDARHRGRARRRARHAPHPGARAMTATRDHPRPRPAPPTDVDLVVIGLGVTGAGVALDAATRGLVVLAVDAHDLAFGTSRWSSKLVHGGLRYLATGQVGVAHESAVERGILMEVTAPHLTHALPMLLPLTSSGHPPPGRAARAAALHAGDVLRRVGPHPRRRRCPAPRRVSRTEALQMAPGAAAGRAARRPALLGRPARGRRPAGHHASRARRRRTAPTSAPAPGCSPRPAPAVDAARRARPARPAPCGARAVVNAAGVWAGDLVDEVTPAAQPRHPPGAPRGDPPGPDASSVTAPSRAPATASCWCCRSPTARSTSA